MDPMHSGQPAVSPGPDARKHDTQKSTATLCCYAWSKWNIRRRSGAYVPPIFGTASEPSPAQVSCKMSISKKESQPGLRLSTEEGQCRVFRKALNLTSKVTEYGQLSTSSGEMMMCGQLCHPVVQSVVGPGARPNL